MRMGNTSGEEENRETFKCLRAYNSSSHLAHTPDPARILRLVDREKVKFRWKLESLKRINLMKTNSASSQSNIVAKLEQIFHLDASSQPKRVPSFLVIGYGNSTHGDDAIGPQVATAIGELELQNVESFTLQELRPELSAKLATVDCAIFVKACQMKNPTVKIRNLKAYGLETTGSSVPGYDRSWLPCSLLALTQSVYGRHPQSWWVEVAARDLGIGHPLSHRANQSIQIAVEQIEDLIHQYLSVGLVKQKNLLETFPQKD